MGEVTRHTIANELITEFATRKETKDRYDISCNKGLWSVSAPTKEIAEREARHYIMQYYFDGEYDW